MKKSFKQIQSSKIWAGKSKPKANWQDDKFIYACQNLITCCTAALREGVEAISQPVADASEQAIVCANIAISCFTYFDEATLAERIGACSELSACCELLGEALGSAEFDGAQSCLEAAQACYDLCVATAGLDQEEDSAPAQEKTNGGTVTVESKAPAKKVSAKRRNPGWLTVKAEEDGEGTETYNMTIDGVIGESVDDDSMVAATEFKNALAEIPKGKPINVHIKSPGGSCIDGYAIYQALQDRKDDVTVHVTAALSIASIIALGGGRTLTSLASQWMLHRPLAQTYGNEADHQSSIDMLKSFGSTMADVYSAHSGMSKDEALDLMSQETWLTGKEAVELGLADAIDEEADEDKVADAVRTMATACLNKKDSRYAIAAYYQPKKSISASAKAGSENKPAGPAASITQEANMEKTTTPVAAAPTASLEERFNQERKARITAEVNRRAAGKIKNDQLDWWVAQALATQTAEAEQGVYAQLESLPMAAAPGGEALRPDKPEASAGHTPVFEVPVAHGAMPRSTKRLDWMEDTRKIKNRAERMAVAKKDWAGKLNYCMELDARENKGLPVAANTYSATLITDFLVDQAVTILLARLAALGAFSIEFGPDRYKEYATGQVKFVTSAGSTLKGTKNSPITNFEQGDGTVVPISVPMTHYVKSFNVSQEDFMSGLRIENLMQLNLLQFAKDVTLDALQPIAANPSSAQIPGPLNSGGNVTAFSAGTIHINAGTFGWNAGQTDGHDLASLWGYLKNSPEKNLILDGNLYGRLTNSPGFFQPTFEDERGGGDRVQTFGWDRIEENTVWPSITDAAGNAIGGLACNRQAILGVTGLPMTPPSIPGAVLQETVVTLPGPDISISMFTWFNLQARKLWNSFELMGGFAGGDASAGAVIYNGKGSVS